MTVRALRIVLFLLCCLPASAQIPWQEAQVVFLGEKHDSQRDHEGQLAFLQAVEALDERPIIVAAEMFTETARSELKSFAEFEDFQGFTEEFWEEQWGHPYSLYHPIFSWIHDNDAVLTDLRPDPDRTQQVKNEGIGVAVNWLDSILLGPKAYRDHMAEIVADHMPEGTEPSQEVIDRYFLVQCFWDEYMAWRVHQLSQQHPGARIIVLVGHGHLQREYGIPPRLSRRDADLKWVTVGFGDDGEWSPDIWYENPSPLSGLGPTSPRP